MSESESKRPRRNYLTALGAWAFAFGCVIGWDAFFLPESSFLLKGGPVGAALGLVLGGLAMLVFAWNYHVMMCRYPGFGGAYTYASEEFGRDHGYVCAWFLCLFYMSVVWIDATVIAMVMQYVFGERFEFGFTYSVHGHEVYFGNVLMSSISIAVAAAVCCRRRLAAHAQSVVAILSVLGIVACFAFAALHHTGGAAALGPGFREGGLCPAGQVLRMFAVALLLFFGFETISNLSGEFAFPAKKGFSLMAGAIVTAIAAYILLLAIPVLRPPEGCRSWLDILLVSPDELGLVTLDAVRRSAGSWGVGVIGVTLVSAVFTNLIGNTVAASRLVAAMAGDGALPRTLGCRNRDGAPRNAIIALAAVSLGVSALGMTAISVMADIAVVGVLIAYAYTSASTIRLAHRTASRLSLATGVCGVVLAAVMAVLFFFPAFTEDNTLMSAESYLAIVLWSLAGLVVFFAVFRGERGKRFGRYSMVWVLMLGMILFMSMMWTRQAMYDTTAAAFNDIVAHHRELCRGGEAPAAGPQAAQPGKIEGDWQGTLLAKLSGINRSIVRNSVVQLVLTIMAFGLTFGLYTILRRREREMEQEKARAKSYFFSTVSHDIRTPLNAILGFSEMLRAGMSTEAERNQALDAILLSGKTLLGLINDVLDLSKLESGKMQIVPEPTDCVKLMRELVEVLRMSSHKSGLDVRCRIDGDMPPLMLDPQRVRQIVFNLVGNAIKFTERGYVELRATYDRDAKSSAGEFRIDVEDSGCGINEEDNKYIGKAYVQVGSKVSRNGGTGLGLAICNQLAAAMGGYLRFSSTLGKGSLFSVVLPAVRMASPDDYHVASAVFKPMPKKARHAAFKIHRILVVDDSRMNIMVLKAFLHHLGNYDVVSAADGKQALDILKASGAAPFDLVLTDLWMPNLDGKGLLAAIRSDPALASLPVIAVTADVEMRDQLAKSDFSAMLFKPVTCDKLRETIAGMERRLNRDSP